MKKGGAAKGELVLAIFELANCFRHGWGVKIDKYAAKQVRRHESLGLEKLRGLTDLGQYYETAANLGDTGKSYQRPRLDSLLTRRQMR